MQPIFRHLFMILLVVQVILFGVFTEHRPFGESAQQMSRYPLYLGVQVMLLLGFGYLMTFLHKATLTAVSHTFLVSCFTMLWAMLNRGFWRRVFKHDQDWTKIQIGLDELITAEFAAAAILISFGAMIGRITAAQLCCMAFFETILYAMNEAICIHKLGMADTGGSIVIHAFGAFFGLACSWALNRHKDQDKPQDDNMSNDITDTFAMIGTTLLWLYWPSFVTAMTDYSTLGTMSVTNCVMALLCSCVTAFYMSSVVYEDKFRMVEIQNSTLAGGVAIGTCCTMNIGIFGAMLIGIIAGLVSVCGYRWVQTYLQENISLLDTCGICYLHGLPGLIGGLCSCIGAAVATSEAYSYKDILGQNKTLLYAVFPARDPASHWGGRTASHQAWIQFACTMLTLGIAIVSGLLVGYLLHCATMLDQQYHDYVEYQRASATELDPAQPNLSKTSSQEYNSPALRTQASQGFQAGALQRQPSLTGSLGDDRDPLNALAPRGRLAKKKNAFTDDQMANIQAPLVEHKDDGEDDVQFH